MDWKIIFPMGCMSVLGFMLGYILGLFKAIRILEKRRKE